jgi:hypothetical protein
MSELKATPGPWIADEFCEENDQATRVGTYDGTPTYYHRTATVALCQTNHDDDEPATVPRIGIVAAEANARLIAAAPDLYEALRTARGQVVALMLECGHSPEVAVANVSGADAALAKARGEGGA